MAEPKTVADGVKAMVDAVSIPVTVKHRIGIDRVESYEFVRDFVGTVSEAGCNVFMVHARNAWLDGLSPKENREVPPLRYELAYRLKRDFPQLTIGINGGITTNAQIAEHLQQVDGVMVGREAYHNPWLLTSWDETFFGAAPSTITREAVEEQMVSYMERAFTEDGCPWYAIARHMLGPPDLERPPLEALAAARGVGHGAGEHCRRKPARARPGGLTPTSSTRPSCPHCPRRWTPNASRSTHRPGV